MRKILWPAAATIALSSYPALAQQAAEPSASTSDVTLGEIIVTANKREERLQNVPAAISVVLGDALEKIAAAQFTQYFDTIPGLSAVPAGQAGKANVAIRGITTGAGQINASVGTYINDVPFGSAGGLALGGTFIADPNTFDIERIEVLKGPQGTLYGASTLGGLIKTVYTSPKLGVLEGRIMLDGSTVEGGDQGYMVNALVNAPLGKDLAVRIVGGVRRDAGFVDSISPGNAIENFNSARAYNARGVLLYKPDNVFSAELTAIYQRTNSFGINQVDVDPVTMVPVSQDLSTAYTFIRPSDRLEYQIYSGKLVYDFGFAALTSISSYGRYAENQRLDATAAIPFGPPILNAQRITLGNFTQEVRLASPSGGRFEWLIGGFYTHQSNTWKLNIDGVDARTLELLPLQVYDFNGDTRYEEVAGFANGTVKLTDALSVTGGIRYAYNRQRYAYSRAGLIVGPPSDTQGRSSDGVVTYLGSVQYKPVDNLLLYFKTASGYRPGGPQVSNLTGLNLRSTFDPDKTRNYEVGAKWSSADGKFNAYISGFYIDWTAIQLLTTVVLNVNGTTIRRSLIDNAGAASSRGFDLALRYRPVRGLNLAVDTGYTNARLDETAPSLGGGKGERIPYVPRWTASGSVGYDFALGGSVTGRVGATGRYVDARPNYFLADPAGNVSAFMPAYFILDLRAGATFGPWDVGVRLTNVTNRRAILSSSTLAFQDVPPFGVAANAAVVAQPRTYGLTVSRKF